MTVYVGVPMWPFGRMIMCHMFSDNEKELDDMAKRLGLRKAWKQRPTHSRDFPHYDISKSKRAEAIKYGAVACEEIIDEADALQLVRKEYKRG